MVLKTRFYYPTYDGFIKLGDNYPQAREDMQRYNKKHNEEPQSFDALRQPHNLLHGCTGLLSLLEDLKEPNKSCNFYNFVNLRYPEHPDKAPIVTALADHFIEREYR